MVQGARLELFQSDIRTSLTILGDWFWFEEKRSELY